MARDIRLVARTDGVLFFAAVVVDPSFSAAYEASSFVINRGSGVHGTTPLFRFARSAAARRWVLCALQLTLCATMANEAVGQAAQQQRGRKAGALGQNFPNPFQAETTIPFTVGDDACIGGTQQHSVTVKIFNVLAQVVAIPLLGDSTAVDSSAALHAERPLENVSLRCGSYQAIWNGKVMRTGQDAASGVYVYQLIIDGQPVVVRKMLVAR